ncbi:MAG: DUF1772 domain-containing protein [Panacagrimonas sp.]
MIPEFIALICSGVFTGAALYVSLVQHPAATKLGTSAAVDFFCPMYARAAPFQASLALLGSLAALWAWWSASGWLWLLGAVVLAFVIPFTLIVIKPTNDRLMDPSLDSSSDEASNLLVRWSRLHAVRRVASFLSFSVFVVALAGS